MRRSTIVMTAVLTVSSCKTRSSALLDNQRPRRMMITDPSDSEHITLGSSKETVRRLLGEPDHREATGPHHSLWVYNKQFLWSFISPRSTPNGIYFQDDRVTGWDQKMSCGTLQMRETVNECQVYGSDLLKTRILWQCEEDPDDYCPWGEIGRSFGIDSTMEDVLAAHGTPEGFDSTEDRLVVFEYVRYNNKQENYGEFFHAKVFFSLADGPEGKVIGWKNIPIIDYPNGNATLKTRE